MRTFVLFSNCFVFLYLFQQTILSQVAVDTTNPLQGTAFQVDGTNSGVLINRVVLTGTDDTTTIASLGAIQEGLMVYNTNTSVNANPETDVVPGFYYWTSSEWRAVGDNQRSKSGWVSLSDSDYSIILPFINSPDLTDFSNFENIDLDFSNDPADNIIDTFAPDGYLGSDFYDDSINRLTPINVGDSGIIRLQFDATPLQNNGVIVIQFDIGVNDIPGDGDDIVIYQKSIPLVRGGTRVTNVSETILFFELGSFFANGGKLRMAYTRSNNNAGSTCTISNFSMVIQRFE